MCVRASGGLGRLGVGIVGPLGLTPCIGRASLETRKTTIRATSDGSEKGVLLGVLFTKESKVSLCSGSVRNASFIGVFVAPGAIELMLTSYGASSLAMARVIKSIPALHAQYRL